MEQISYDFSGVYGNGELFKKKISINVKNLIKPEDLNKHIGEVLSFHNARGYVVTAVLEEAVISQLNEYSYGDRIEHIDYSDELDMDWFYSPDDTLAEYETLMYAYVIVCQNIHRDELMHNIEYIAVPTQEELDFRNKVLSMNKNKLEKRYSKLRKEYKNK